MILIIISGIILAIGLLAVIFGDDLFKSIGFALMLLSAFMGIFVFGLLTNVKQVTKEIIPLKIQKNEFGTTVFYLDKENNSKVQTIYTDDIRIANTTNELYVVKVIMYNSYGMQNQVYYVLLEK